MRSFAARVATCAVAAVCVAGAVAPAAVADPPPGVVPAATDLVGVGAVLTEGFMNQTSAEYNAAAPAGQPRLYGWDAKGSSPIVPKDGATSIVRPNGSGYGFRALAESTSATVDYARSARTPLPGDPTGYSFLPFAKDAVTWAAKSGGNAPNNLTTAQLKGIYECTITNWAQIGGVNAVIKPFLPQRGADVSIALLKVLGGGVAVTPGLCVNFSDIQFENRGTDPLLDDVNVVIPYSVGIYIDQAYKGHRTPEVSPGPLRVRSVDGIPPVVLSPGRQVINPSLLTSPYGRQLWHIVRTAEFNGSDAHAEALVGVFGPKGWICLRPASIEARGFSPIPDCGVAVDI
ncbi:substrate-binding domain-containing protein [Kitasatospora sp. NPDC058032]|uniref:substrate-binding domain-containing protein n=1 Tax=Kitasatospora sp. NPDC058032 TaxID=3346307 RepID=UPI0036DDE5FC